MTKGQSGECCEHKALVRQESWGAGFTLLRETVTLALMLTVTNIATLMAAATS